MEVDEQAGLALGQLLDLLKIRTIICVDDLYVATGDSASIIGWLATAIAAGQVEQVEQVSQLLGGLSHSAPDDVWSQQLRERWDSASPEERSKTGLEVAQVLGQVEANDRSAMQRLTEMVGGDSRLQLRELTPDRWVAEGDQLLAAATQEARVLCLFDQNLSAAGRGPDGGTELLVDAIRAHAQETEGRAFFALLVTTQQLTARR